MGISGLLLAGVLAMGPQWTIIDLPYPEVKSSEAVGGYAQPEEARINESIAGWVARTAPGRKHEVTQLRIDGPRASARVILPDRTWLIRLQRVGGDWKVVER